MVRAARPAVQYYGFVDVASGVGLDSFAASVAHREGELVIVDVAHEIKPKFSAEAAVAEVAALFKSYGIERPVGDKWGAGLTVAMFGRHGLDYEYSERDRSALYVEVLPLFSSGRARLVDNKKLVTQFASLERRTSSVGRDRIDHGRDGRDDLCNAVAGAMTLAASDNDDIVDEFLRAWSPASHPSHHEEAEEKRRLAEQQRRALEREET